MQTVVSEMKRVCPAVADTIRLVKIAIDLCGDPRARIYVSDCTNRTHCLRRHLRLDDLPGCLLFHMID